MRRQNVTFTGVSATYTRSQSMTCQIPAHVTADLFVRRGPRLDPKGLHGFTLPDTYIRYNDRSVLLHHGHSVISLSPLPPLLRAGSLQVFLMMSSAGQRMTAPL